jgi:pilus assembly protein CpaF
VGGVSGFDELLSDPGVSEILLNGGGGTYVERDGRLEPVTIDLDEAGVRRVVERIIAPLGLRLDRASPMVDARLPDGSRLHAILPPVAVDGPCVAIRRFGAGRRALADFGLTPAGETVLRRALGDGWNLLLSGGTGAGKTTLLNVLGGAVAPQQRIVTIEETAELSLGQPHVVRLEARPANAEGAGAIPVRSLVRAALRLRPDRLIVGEVRGGEAFDLLQALNTGHRGSLCTIHANGPAEALARLESLVLLAGTGLPLDAIRAQIRSAVDAVVHVVRRPDGARTVDVIAELCGPTGLRTLYPSGRDAVVPTRPRRP